MASASRRVLITGLSGFVGGHICQMQGAIEKTYGCTILPDQPFDLCDQNAVDQLIADSKPDWVIHLAAQSNVPAAFQDPELTLQINMLGTLHLLQALDRHHFKGRLLYVSSGDVYGATPEASLPIVETQLPHPGNPYAVSKVAAEALCLQWHLKCAYGILVARPFNHIGPGQRPDFVVASIAQQIVNGGAEPSVMVGDIDVTRDFLDVRDVIRAYFVLLDKGRSGTIYNVCSGQEQLVRNLANRLACLSGKQVTLLQDPSRFRPADQRRVYGSNQRISEDTGWKPQLSLDQTLQDILNVFRNLIGQES